MKKKILLVVLAGVLTLTLGTATVFAASENFTDQNDGVCDNYQSTTRPLDGTGSQYRQCGGAQNGSGNGNGNQYGKK